MWRRGSRSDRGRACGCMADWRTLVPKEKKVREAWYEAFDAKNALGDAVAQCLGAGVYVGFSLTRTGDLSITLLKDGEKEKAYAEGPDEIAAAVLEGLEALTG